MSPIHDPRYSKARWIEVRRQEVELGEQTARLEYVKPIVVLAAGLPLALIQAVADAHGGVIESAAWYLVSFGASVAVAMMALVIAARLGMGDAGPLGLAVLRLAGACAATDAVYLLFAPSVDLFLYPALIATFVFVALMAWLFDMDVWDAALVGIIVWVVRLIAPLLLFFWGG